MPSPITSRLRNTTPALAIITAIVLVLAGVAVAAWLEQNYESQKIDEISAQARILADTVTAALTFNDKNAAQEYVNALHANPEIEVAGVYDAAGELFAGFATPPSEAPRRIEVAPGARIVGGRIEVAVPARQDNAELGTVFLETVVDPIPRRVARYAVITAFVGMAVLIVLVFGWTQRALRRANLELEARAGDLVAANASLETQIAERQKAEEALRQAQKMEAIGQLTGGVAHDFNNILQVVIGNLDMLRRRAAQQGPEILPLVEAATRGATRAATLTAQLLAFARRQPLAPKPIEVNRLVGGMSEILHRTLGENVSVETVLAAGVWRASADANQLESALLNLALNARDAMAGGGKLTIETANSFLDEHYAAANNEVAPGQYVMIAVTDTGMGMSEETVAKAFEPFFTTKEVGRGSGLGLSQVYGFMRQSGGHAKIYSEPGEGTTIKLYLPRLASDRAPREAAPEAPALRGGSASDLILLVEDDHEVRANTVSMLRDLGYDVIEAPDAATGLQHLESSPGIRLVFTDVGLPGGMNGRQFADEALRRRPRLKVLYSTGYARNAIVHQGRLDPGVDLITKPFTYAALAVKLRQVLERDG